MWMYRIDVDHFSEKNEIGHEWDATVHAWSHWLETSNLKIHSKYFSETTVCMLLDHHYEKKRQWNYGKNVHYPKMDNFTQISARNLGFLVFKIFSTDFSSKFSRLIPSWGIIIQLLAWRLWKLRRLIRH